VTFLRDTIGRLEQRYCIDETRVDMTGFSGGARMASQAGCDLPTRIAAIAPASGLRFPSPCPTSRPVPVLAFHGTADPVDPYDGHGPSYWTESVPEAARRWAEHDRCVKAKDATVPAASPGVPVTTYGTCAAGTSVSLETISGAGHTWPGGPPLPAALRRVLGPQSETVDANATIAAFFRGHPLR
jgi:polyhydroxybutyrate depolymerase